MFATCCSCPCEPGLRLLGSRRSGTRPAPHFIPLNQPDERSDRPARRPEEVLELSVSGAAATRAAEIAAEEDSISLAGTVFFDSYGDSGARCCLHVDEPAQRLKNSRARRWLQGTPWSGGAHPTAPRWSCCATPRARSWLLRCRRPIQMAAALGGRCARLPASASAHSVRNLGRFGRHRPASATLPDVSAFWRTAVYRYRNHDWRAIQSRLSASTCSDRLSKVLQRCAGVPLWQRRCRVRASSSR